MKRLRYAAATIAAALIVGRAYADYNPTTVLRMPSVAAVGGAHLANYKQFYLAAYGNGSVAASDGGEGSFTKAVSCVDDAALTCIHDVDGIAFTRDNVTGDLRHAGLTKGSVYDANAHPTTVSDAAPIITSAVTALAALGLHNFTTSQVPLKIGSSITIPPNSALTCEIVPSVISNADYTGLPGTLWLGHGATLIGSGSSAPASNCIILPEWYLNPAKATFPNGNTGIQIPALAYGDFDGLRQNMIAAGDTAIECITDNGVDGCQPHDLLIGGFDTGVYGFQTSHMNAQNLTIDANVGIFTTLGGGQTDFRSVDVEPVLAKGGINNEEYWNVDGVTASTHNNNAAGHPVCELTLSHGVDKGGASTTWDTRDILSSILDAHGNPISYPVWMANATNAAGDPYGCNGRWPVAAISYGGGSGSASTAIVDLLGSDFAHASGGGSLLTTTGQWNANSLFVYIRGQGCGIPQPMHVGQVVTSGGTGFPSGTVKVAAILHHKGMDPTDAFRCTIILSAPTTAAQSTDVNISFDSGVYHVPSGRCDGHAAETCLFLNAAERMIAGNSAGGADTARIPQSYGSQLGAAFFFDNVAGPRGINTFCFGHHYCFANLDADSTSIVQEGGDDNGELDDPLQVYSVFAGLGNSASITTNKNSKTGASIVNDTYSVSDNISTNTTSTAANALGIATGSLLVGSTTGFAANGGVLAICTVVKGDGTCNTHQQFEYVNYTITDGTHFKLFERGVFGTIAQTFPVGSVTLIDQSIDNLKGCVSYFGLNNPTTTSYLNQYEALHGCLHLTNLRTNGLGSGFVSHNMTSFSALGNYMPATVNYYEDSTARSASSGAANTMGSGDPTSYVVQPLKPQGRLTFNANQPVLGSASGASSTIYYVPYIGSTMYLFDGIGWNPETIAAQSLDISNAGNFAAGNVFDVYAFMNRGVATLCAVQWPSTTSRGIMSAQNQTYSNGMLTNIRQPNCSAGATTYALAPLTGLYLGSFYTTGNGQSTVDLGFSSAGGGAAPCICLWNNYNRVPVVAANGDTTANWTTTSTSWEALNAGAGGGAGNRIYWVDGEQEETIRAELAASFKSSAAGTTVSLGIVPNSTTATPTISAAVGNADYSPATVPQVTAPRLGYNYVQAMQRSAAATTETILGNPAEALRLETEY